MSSEHSSLQSSCMVLDEAMVNMGLDDLLLRSYYPLQGKS